jgi:hypothetical protein
MTVTCLFAFSFRKEIGTLLAPQSEFQKQIQRFIISTYSEPYSFLLNPREIEQLAWIKDNTSLSNEKNVLYIELMKKEPSENQALREVKRVVARVYCLELLKKGDHNAYLAFTQAQRESNAKDRLQEDSFKILSKQIQQLDADLFDSLRVACVLASVSLSPTAKKLALVKLQQKGQSLPVDKAEFLATTMDHCPEIYPITQTLSERGIAHLKIAYPYRTHFRHMMYTEGGIGMFEALKRKIETNKIDRHGLDFWYFNWIINIAGSSGHINSKGSLTLTENTFKAMSTLKNFLDQFIDLPSTNVLVEYLKAQAYWIGLQEENIEKRLLLAHVAAMLRLYNPENGTPLLAGFDSIPADLQEKILNQYITILTQDSAPTPSYGSALFANGLDALHGDIAKTIQIFLPLYANTIEAYNNLRKEGSIAPDVALNFDPLAAAPNISAIIEQVPLEKLNQVPININPTTGEAKLDMKSFQKLFSR